MRGRILIAALALVAACKPRATTTEATTAAASASAPIATAKLAPAVPERREGQALVLGEGEDALYLADEDHAVLRRIALTKEIATVPASANDKDPLAPVDVEAEQATLVLPGRPAQVLSLGDRVLVTIRDPGLLLVVSAGPQPKEIARVALPADAWGIAVAPDGKSAYVSSAWSRKLSRIDLGDAPKLAWSVDVEREPRGVATSRDGSKVWVTHLVNADVTTIDVTGEPRVTTTFLPPAPLQTLAGEKLDASLGYAAVVSPDGNRLFAARHALGAMWQWQGIPSVDVLATATSQPVAPGRGGRPLGQLTTEQLQQMGWLADASGTRAEGDGTSWSQPRAMIYRKKTRHLLVASEGHAVLAELDALSAQPGLITNRVYRLGGLVTAKLPQLKYPPKCGAPTGVALSRDESVAWVYCRTTDNLVAVRLTPDGVRPFHQDRVKLVHSDHYEERLTPWGPFAFAALAPKPSDDELQTGRRLFFDATDEVVSQNLACAGCHPDGRDDGHVWREQQSIDGYDLGTSRFLAGPSLSFMPDQEPKDRRYGFARQTPMLAGRVASAGPYGWHAEATTLVDRIREGFSLHRAARFPTDGVTMKMRADPIARFVREGLVPPPRDAHPPTELERQGQALFVSARTECATCHVPEKEFTDRSVRLLRGFPVPPLFTDDPNMTYKVPSLAYVGNTEPYYHDGSALTLEALIDDDRDRMGKTQQLTPDERRALVAYLRTL